MPTLSWVAAVKTDSRRFGGMGCSRGRGLPIASPRRMGEGFCPTAGRLVQLPRPLPTLPTGLRARRLLMFPRPIAVLLLGCLTATALPAFAAETPPGPVAPEMLAAGNVEITRN